MNVILRTQFNGFVENAWIGHTLKLGETTRLSVALHDPRCVMVTLAQYDLPKDTDILRALVRDNRVQLGDLGAFPCAEFMRSSPHQAQYELATTSHLTEHVGPWQLMARSDRYCSASECRLPGVGYSGSNWRLLDMTWMTHLGQSGYSLPAGSTSASLYAGMSGFGPKRRSVRCRDMSAFR